MSHPRDFLRFILTGMKSTSAIADAMMEKASAIDIWVPLMMDTESGYVGAASRIGFAEQKQTMMDITAQGKGRIMPFFAYDPRSRSVDAVKTGHRKRRVCRREALSAAGFQTLRK